MVILEVLLFLQLGNTAPLWLNPNKLFYKVLFILCLICSLIFVGSFIAIQYYNNTTYNGVVSFNNTNYTIFNSTNTTNTIPSNQTVSNNNACVSISYEYLKSSFIVIGSIILFLNCKAIFIFSYVLPLYDIC
jgi:hypothetical protein